MSDRIGRFVLERDGTSNLWTLGEVIVESEGPVWVADVRFSEFETKQAEIVALLASAADLLDVVKRIRGWDMLDVTEDGPFWKRELDAVLAKAQGDSSE